MFSRGDILIIALIATALGGPLLACSAGPHDAPSNEVTGGSAKPANGQDPAEGNASSGDANGALDLAAFITDSSMAQRGTCLTTERAPARSRLIYSLLPTEASYLRLTIVTSKDGTRPEMVDLARGLTGGRILYATRARGAAVVRLEIFRSASDLHPVVTDVPLDDRVAQRLLLLGQRALALRCQST
jgi:hypothetical protein